jgi:hypothetical protein
MKHLNEMPPGQKCLCCGKEKLDSTGPDHSVIELPYLGCNAPYKQVGYYHRCCLIKLIMPSK